MAKFLSWQGLEEYTGLIKTFVNNLQNDLTGKINGKADSSHTHPISNIENLQSSLNSKSDSDHKHDDLYEAKGAANSAISAAASDATAKANAAEANAKTYTNTKTSGLASTTVVDNKISSHNTSDTAHNDIRALIDGLTTRLNALADSDDTTLDQLSEIVAYIKSNKGLIDDVTTNKVNVSDIVNNLTTNVSNKPLSAAQGVVIKNLIDALEGELDSHTHKYAESSSVGGAATSANKLNANAGSETQPVYFANGIPVATTYTLGKSVPSDAKFTDTTYSVATPEANGLMSADDKKKIGSVTGTTYTFGAMGSKTIADLRNALDYWLNLYSSTANATAIFSADTSWITAWNSGDTSATLKAGVQWTVTNIATYSTKAYTQLRISTYGSKHVYYVARENGTWGNVSKTAFKEDLDLKQDKLSFTANRAIVSDANGKPVVSATTSNEIWYLSGAKSNVQTQLDNKIPFDNTNAVYFKSGDDLNNFKTVGTYISGSSSDTSGLVNAPMSSGSGFKMTVVDGYISGRVTQFVTTNSNEMYYRQFNGTNWGAWDKYSTTAELNTAKSTLQASIDGKQAKITGGASTIASSNLTASRALVSDTNGKVAASSVTSTQLGYLSGVTSAIQTQLNGKLSTSGTAAKATADASGNTITSTYATKTELNAAKTTLQTAIDGKSNSDHTHNYAGSSSAGGAANSVTGKLTVDVSYGASGGATSLIYDGSKDMNLSISASPLDHTHNYAASSSAGGDAKKAEVLSQFYLDSSESTTSGYWNPYTYGVGTWGAVAGTYILYDSEGTGFNGIFSIKVRCGADGKALDGALSWLTANSTTPPVLTMTHSFDSSQTKTIFRLYITVGGGWRSYKLTKISEVGANNFAASSSIVTSMTGTTFLTASSIAVSGGSAGVHTHSISDITGGGTLIDKSGASGSSEVPLYLQSYQNTGCYLGLKNSNGTVLGYFGVGSDGKPYFYDTGYKTILHSGNWSSYCAGATHYHDDRYYTESEVNTLLNAKASLNTVVNFNGVSLGNSNPYIYTENNNINFRWYWSNTWRYYSMEDIYTKLVLGGAITHGYLTIQNDFIRSSTNSVSLRRNGSDTDGFMVAGNCRPLTDNVMTSGSSSYRWKQLYAATTTINTSDRNAKRDFRTFDSNENYEKLFMDLKPLVFKFKDGESKRDHFGFVSQDVEDSLYKYNFDDKSFAGFCKDIKVEYVEDEDGNGEEVPVLDENGNEQYVYGLRYGEFTAFNTWMIQKLVKKNEVLEARISQCEVENQELKAEIVEIKKMIAELKG